MVSWPLLELQVSAVTFAFSLGTNKPRWIPVYGQDIRPDVFHPAE